MNSEMKQNAIDKLLTSLRRRMARERNIKSYLDSVSKFCEFAETKPDQIVSDVKKGKVNLVDYLQKFVDQMINQGLAPKTTRRIFFQVQKFFRANKINVESKSVELPISRVIYTDRAITKDEIKLLLRTGDLRQRWIVLLMSSSGVRLGSIPNLRLKHLEEWHEPSTKNPIMLTIPNEAAKDYRGYVTFITVEAYEALQDYLNLRRKFGEQIDEESFLVRNVFAKEPNGASKPKPLKYYGLNTIMQRMMNTYLHSEKKKRHEFKMSHGFRKFFRTVLDSAGVPVGASEALMGHSGGLVGVYTRHSNEELKRLYAVAMPNLTIEKATLSQIEARKQQMRDLGKLQGWGREKLELLENLLAHATSMEDLDALPEQIQKREKLQQIKTGHETEEDCQRIVAESELPQWLTKGWNVVAVLPSGKIVVSNE